MDYDLIRAALIIVGGVAFYAVLARGLFNTTETSRQKALEIGERLIHSAQVSDEQKHMIYRRLGEVYSNWNAWQLALLMFCVVVTVPFRKRENEDNSSVSGVPPHLREDLERFRLHWMIATVGNSPAATFLFSTLVLVTLAFSASISAITNALAGEHGHHHDGHRAKAT